MKFKKPVDKFWCVLKSTRFDGLTVKHPVSGNSVKQVLFLSMFAGGNPHGRPIRSLEAKSGLVMYSGAGTESAVLSIHERDGTLVSAKTIMDAFLDMKDHKSKTKQQLARIDAKERLATSAHEKKLKADVDEDIRFSKLYDMI